MQYLGEFLSPQNTISLDQDQMVKYFYFRPDSYDDPNADVENIFIIKSMEEFPKRYDLLSENNLYAVDSIEVSKRLSDEDTSVNNVSYVVKATYDLLINIQNRESGGSSGSSASAEADVDIDGDPVTNETPPWKLRGTWSFTPTEVVVPFTKGWNSTFTNQNVNIVNSAGDMINAETKRYQFEIVYTKNLSSANTAFDNVMAPIVNNSAFDLYFDGRPPFPSGTLLMLPPTSTLQYHQTTNTSGEVEYTPYFTYTVRIIYDNKGWKKNLLNTGIRAKFSSNGISEQIYMLTISSPNGVILDGYPQYVSFSAALQQQAASQQTGNIVSVEAVTEPLPLTSTGAIDMNVINDPVNNTIVELNFDQYKMQSFSGFSFQ